MKGFVVHDRLRNVLAGPAYADDAEGAAKVVARWWHDQPMTGGAYRSLEVYELTGPPTRVDVWPAYDVEVKQ